MRANKVIMKEVSDRARITELEQIERTQRE